MKSDAQRTPRRPAAAATGDTPASMSRMTEEEVRDFIGRNSFGVLALADSNRAFGFPLFYGVHEGTIFFRTRPGAKTHYLYRTMEACLTVSRFRNATEWASAQVFGHLERVDERSPAAEDALHDIPPPLAWDSDEQAEAAAEEVTTFRLGASRELGRYTNPAIVREPGWGIAFAGM